jgi:hypothetical protein
MAFTWTTTIGVGNKVLGGISTVSAIQELRANTDWLSANRNYCATHYITYDSAVHHTNYTSHYPSYYDGHNTTDRSAHDASYYDGYDGSYLSGYNGTYNYVT